MHGCGGNYRGHMPSVGRAERSVRECIYERLVGEPAE